MAIAYVSSYSAAPEAHPAGHPCFMVLHKCSVVLETLNALKAVPFTRLGKSMGAGKTK